MKKFDDLINELHYKNFLNVKYYSFVSLRNYLNFLNDSKIIVGDLLLVPFYIANDKIYEIYDFELYIKIKGECLEKYILLRTGKGDISNVDSEIVDKFKECYITLEDKLIATASIIDYINYMFNNKELKNRIYDIFGEYCINNLFFTFY